MLRLLEVLDSITSFRANKPMEFSRMLLIQEWIDDQISWPNHMEMKNLPFHGQGRIFLNS